NAGAAKSLTINTGGVATWTSALITNIGTGGINIASTGDITGASNGVLTTTGGLTLNANLTSTSVTITIQTTAGQTISGTGTLAKLDISANTTNNGILTVTTTLASTVASTLTQGSSSTLTYGGNTVAPTLDASAIGNTVDYNQAGTQTIKSTPYQNITISGSGNKTLGGAITVNGNLTVNAGTLVTSTFQITGNATGTLSVAAGAALTLGLTTSAAVVDFPADFTTANISLDATSTVTYQGNNMQTISSVPTYGNLTINTFSGSKVADGDITVTGNLITTSPVTLDMTSNTLNLTGTYTGTGALSFSSGNFNIGGTFTNTGTFTAGTGTVTYNGSGAQAVKGITYYNLTITSGNIATAGASFTCNNNLSLTSGTFASGAFTIIVSGATTISGGTLRTSNAAGLFNLQSLSLTGGSVAGTATGNVNVATTLSVPSGSATIGRCNLTVTGATTVSGTLDFNSALGVKTLGDITINIGGTWTSTGNSALTITGSLTNDGTFAEENGMVTFIGSSAQTITGACTFNNITVNNAAGVTASANQTVNGVLYLSSNASATQGCLEMSTYTLTMGANATTTGTGDVTGIVKRTSLDPATSYTFGNQYTTINFRNVGTLPTDVSVKITIGSAPAWKTDAVERTYDIIQTGGSGSFTTLNLHYLDSELNGNTENTLVKWACDAPFIPGTAIEFGRSNYEVTDNWVGTSSFDVSLWPTSFDTRIETIGNSVLSNTTWNGSISTVWTNPGNWTPKGIPSDLSDVIIPDTSTTINNPTLGISLAVGRLTIESGGILNSAATSTVTISGGNGAWSDNGGTFNASTGTVIFTNAVATISGVTDFYNVTINSGAVLTLGSGGTMRISGTMTNNGTWRAAQLANNTVEYNGGSQTVLNPNGATPGYDNLILSGSGTKTMPGTALAIAGDFSMSDTATATAGAAMTIEGDFTLGSGTTFTTGALSHSIGGDFLNNGGTFTAIGNTIMLDGSSAQTIGGTAATMFDNLTLNNAAGALLGNSEIVNGTLTLTSGRLTTTSSYTLTMGTAGIISGGSISSYVNGNLQKNFPTNAGTQSFTYTIGDASIYTPVVLDISNVNISSNPVNIIAYIASTDTNESSGSGIDQTKKADCYWFVNENASPGIFDTYDITLNLSNTTNSGEAGGTIEGYTIKKFDPSTWASTSSTVTNNSEGNRTIKATGLTSFSDFESGEDCTAPTITLGGNPSVCSDTISVNLTYSATTGSPDQYTIDYNAAAEGQGFADVAYTTLPSSPILLTVPGGAAEGTYNGTLKVKNSSTGCESSGYEITVTVTNCGYLIPLSNWSLFMAIGLMLVASAFIYRRRISG
ncbi:MAG: hypothetical protein M0Q51_11595, partial [Bacteroidales bacterium]|nr:hypothetical protein [Bacteroidales bacterium]